MNEDDEPEDKYSSAPPVRRTFRGERPMMLALATSALMAASVQSPPRRGLPPLPPPRPEDEPPHPCEGKAYSGPYGRPGKAPIPRAFYSSRLLPGEDELKSLVAQGEKRASDERHLTTAEEKRARKARKRLGK